MDLVRVGRFIFYYAFLFILFGSLLGVAYLPVIARKFHKLSHIFSIAENDEGEFPSAEALLLVFIELTLQVFFSWTLAYYFVALLRLPAFAAYIVAGLLLFVVIGWSIQYWKKVFGRPPHVYWFFLLTLIQGALMGYYTLITRPFGDDDDIDYFHRPLVQLSHLNQPFILTDVTHNTLGLPVVAPNFNLPSYEHFVAMTAHALHIDPLLAYFKAFPFFTAIVIVAVFVLIYRMLGLKRPNALLAIAIILIFVFIDVDMHRSIGQFTFTRLWQGKTMVWTLCMPIALLSGYRFLQAPNPRDFVRFSMSVVAAPGFSSSGLFMMPAFVGCMSIAYVLNEHLNRETLKRAVMLNIPLLYNVLLLTAVLLDLLPTHNFTEIFVSWGYEHWLDSLKLVIPNYYTAFRNLLILSLIPLATLQPPYRRFFLLLSAIIIGIFMNPLTGQIWFEILSQYLYWRIVYLLPILLCVGLLANYSIHKNTTGIIGYGSVVLIVLVFTLLASSAFGFRFLQQWYSRSPLSYRFSGREYQFIQDASQELSGSNLLAPQTIITIAPLVFPDIRLETQRPEHTYFKFAAIGKPDEGNRRVLAQQITHCMLEQDNALDAFLISARNVDTIVMKVCSDKDSFSAQEQAQLIENLTSGGEWELILEERGYLLLKKR